MKIFKKYGFAMYEDDNNWYRPWPILPEFCKPWKNMTKRQKGRYLKAIHAFNKKMEERSQQRYNKAIGARRRTIEGWCEFLAELSSRNFWLAALIADEKNRHNYIKELSLASDILYERQKSEGGLIIIGDYGFAIDLEKEL